ncbi:LysR family transcriptional regulator [Rubellimicrobium aerolatum]|uniref:LysR family transcriptional regulator n=1 Tax=Rubellimicrobium aerolatum TaxID=490979 RepID=A0ABW0SCG8_9RHOB|nr:LysR family transcriptional regulator [Rubellimicrobium aerolatum]MBP1806342.1 DNA-binding transcriptional LysR family regulator [Rubellimicrobium aerolatum]
MIRNLRHLRVFLEVLDTTSVTRAAEACHLSQPAVTQAVAKLEAEAGLPLFRHMPQGLFATEAGLALGARVRRALGRLDAAAAALSPRLALTTTGSQLRALIAVREAENFTLAARRLGLSQPSVHRAVSDLERETGRPLFERTAHGLIATKACRTLADAARLAFAELDQAAMELAEMAGREVGRIVVGSMPLARSLLLPQAIAAFRQTRPLLTIRVEEGPYDDLLGALRRGETDVLIGALRLPSPIADIRQAPLFEDDLVIVARPGHPLAGRGGLTLAEVAEFPFVVNRPGSPIRSLFDAQFADQAIPAPRSLIESGSLILMRQLLEQSDHLGCASRLQVAAEIAHGHLVPLPLLLPGTTRPIGLTTRIDWVPTASQQAFLDCVAQAARARTVRPYSQIQ